MGDSSIGTGVSHPFPQIGSSGRPQQPLPKTGRPPQPLPTNKANIPLDILKSLEKPGGFVKMDVAVTPSLPQEKTMELQNLKEQQEKKLNKLENLKDNKSNELQNLQEMRNVHELIHLEKNSFQMELGDKTTFIFSNSEDAIKNMEDAIQFEEKIKKMGYHADIPKGFPNVNIPADEAVKLKNELTRLNELNKKNGTEFQKLYKKPIAEIKTVEEELKSEIEKLKEGIKTETERDLTKELENKDSKNSEIAQTYMNAMKDRGFFKPAVPKHFDIGSIIPRKIQEDLRNEYA